MDSASDPAAPISLESLPLGYRFRPTDEELVNHYLKGKINGRIDPADAALISVVDVCKFEPWDLKHESAIKSNDSQWFFFAERDRKYSPGQRTNRATKKGYWKATGRDREIKSRNGVKGGPLVVVGKKRTLVFHMGRAPNGERTCWIMHEYSTVQGGYVLCRLFDKREEMSSNSSPKTDEIEKHVNSPTLSVASNQENDLEENKKNDLEEDVKLTIEKSPELHCNEERALPKASTQERALQCNNNIVINSADHYDVEVMGEGDATIECDAENQQIGPCIFPDFGSPIRSCNDYYWLDNHNALLNHTFLDFEMADDDFVNEFLATKLSNQEEYSPDISSGHADQFANIVPRLPVYDVDLGADSPRESIHAKERASSRDLENEGAFPQDLRRFVDSDWSDEPYLSSKNRLQSMTVKRSIHSNQNVQDSLNVPPADFIQSHFDLVEVNNQEILNDRGICYAGDGMTSCIHQISQCSSNMDEEISMKNADENGFSSVGTGITIRSCQPQHHSGNAVLKQGDAFRRLRLQSSFLVGSLSSTVIESSSSNQADLQDEVSSVEDGESAESYITWEEVSEPSCENKPFCGPYEDEVSANIRKEDDPQITCRPNNAGLKIGSIFMNLKKCAPVSSSKIFASFNSFVSMAYLPLMFAVLVSCTAMWWNLG